MTTSSNTSETGGSSKARIYIGGTFDLTHMGHYRLFERAAKMGHVIISLNTDEFAARYKRKPILTLEERMEAVRACRHVDRVIINEGCEDSKPAIVAARATHILHGDDWRGDALMRQMGLTQEWLDINNIKMLYLPYTDGISTSEIIRRIQTL